MGAMLLALVANMAPLSGVALALTEDFRHFDRCGMVMQPDDKDAVFSSKGTWLVFTSDRTGIDTAEQLITAVAAEKDVRAAITVAEAISGVSAGSSRKHEIQFWGRCATRSRCGCTFGPTATR